MNEKRKDFESKFNSTSLLGDICYINYGMAVNADMSTLIQLMDIGTPTNINNN